MTRNYDYRTPRDRIDSSLRMRTEGENSNRSAGAFRAAVPNNDGCGCRNNGVWLKNDPLPLAMIYSPYQNFENLYESEEALCRGTLFKDLEFPFKAYCCGRKEAWQ